jgi:hypothetical protein
MFELGRRDECRGTEHLRPFTLRLPGGPTSFPRVPLGHSLICGYGQGADERLIVCKAPSDIQKIHTIRGPDGATTIKWYLGKDTDVVLNNLDDSTEI